MSNTICLMGPAFSLIGKELFIDETPAFNVLLEAPFDTASVLRFQWYLNDRLMLDQFEPTLSLAFAYGRSKIGVRLLTSEGWTGIKSLVFRNYPQPTYHLLGPESIDEGSSGLFNVFAKFIDNTTEDFTGEYTFESQEGTFDGNLLLIPKNDTPNDSRNITVTAAREGYSDLNYVLRIEDTSEIILLSTEIVGPDKITEEELAIYNVLGYYNDNSVAVLNGYTFSSTEGSFEGNILTVAVNNIPGSRNIIITAVKSNFEPLTKQVTILSKTIVSDKFNYLTLTFSWNNYGGKGLDVQVMYENTGTPWDNKPVGGRFNSQVPMIVQSEYSYLWWTSYSNPQSRNDQEVLVGLRNFIKSFPNTPNIIEVGIYVNWSGSVNSGQFSLLLNTYIGGVMLVGPHGGGFYNVGGTTVLSKSHHLQIIAFGYRKVAILRFNKTTQDTTIEEIFNPPPL
ncbi:hypothetical protein [Pedobacter ureilyticus]|uniref:Carboxypeptidase regulatory-like domain-containing protein n=1 Tax=Pedobacter ureilyticus TaxID=1393051 RepID=A0ABW9J9H8_9SPHI|nr:hypothetical protein [Pedobacter helvus]